MSEMVERIVRDGVEIMIETGGPGGPKIPARIKVEANMVRGVIAAMRDMTGPMVSALEHYIEDDCSNDREPQIRKGWDAAIDVALK